MRLIDADALRADFHEPNNWSDPEQVLVHITGIWAEIDTAPTIDPVKHGKWMRTGAYPHRIYCSECYATYVRNEEWELWKNDEEGLPRNFCPNCGADMRGEEDGELA